VKVSLALRQDVPTCAYLTKKITATSLFETKQFFVIPPNGCYLICRCIYILLHKKNVPIETMYLPLKLIAYSIDTEILSFSISSLYNGSSRHQLLVSFHLVSHGPIPINPLYRTFHQTTAR
jgi:hypothetical protein